LCAFLNNLGELNCALGKYDQAEAFLQRAMKIRKAALGPDDPDVALSAENLSGMFAASGRWREAASSFDDARRVIRRHIAHVLPALSPAEQQSFLQQTDEGEFCSCISMGVQKRDDPSLVELSTGWLLNGKAVAQEALAQNAQLTRDSADPNTAKIVKQLLEVRRQLASLVYSGPQKGREQDRKTQVDELQVQEAELARQIAQAHGEHFQSDPWVELGAVRKAIPGDAVLVDIAKFDKFDFQAKGPANKYRGYRYAAWIVPPEGQGNVRIIDLGDASQIDAAIKAVGIEMRRAIQQLGTKGKAFDYMAQEQAMQNTLGKLAELALTPVLKEIPEGTKQLIISPDSHLWLAPWAALPLVDGRYAIEQYKIRYSISGRDLIVRQTDGQKSTPPVVMADPNYDLLPGDVDKNTRSVLRGTELATRGSAALRSAVGPTSTSSALPKVRRLPGTKAEADAIVPKIANYTHTDPTVYTDRWALEGVFKKVHGPRLLVLSTHGFFLPDQQAKLDPSAGDDSRSAGPALTVGGEPIENPLLRCGLLLAGCNNGGQQTAKSANANASAIDDGILTGMEIVGADLRGTELVVLSACETALGQVQNGEGVSGLRQAFQLAGAQSVVATLWQIPDADSAAIMAQFFDGISENQPKAEALRQAQLARIEALRQRYGAAHPFFWAAFTLTGE
jgi:CHAT domain-containing protein